MKRQSSCKYFLESVVKCYIIYLKIHFISQAIKNYNDNLKKKNVCLKTCYKDTVEGDNVQNDDR